MKAFIEMTKEELAATKIELDQKYNEFKQQHLNLDMSRGKPSSKQLDLSMELLNCHEYLSNGVDCRNYGGL